MSSPTSVSVPFFLVLALLLPPIISLNTLDSCRTSSECDLEDCVPFSRGTLGSSFCSSDIPTCRCFPFLFLSICFSNSDCIGNETCVIYTLGSSGPLAIVDPFFDFANPFCASPDAVQQFTDIEIFPFNPDSTPTGNRSVIDDTTPISTTGGLTMDTCRDSDACVEVPNSFNRCLALHRGVLGESCVKDFPNCRCLSSSALQGCNTDIDCIVGEVCVTYPPGNDGLFARMYDGDDFDFATSFCVSAEAEATLSDLQLVSAPEGAQPTGTQTLVDVTTPPFVGNRDRLAFELCSRTDDCVDTVDRRSCLAFSDGNLGDPCFSGTDCRCLPTFSVSVCQDHNDCIVEEACVLYTGPRNGLFAEIDNLDFTQPFCMSVVAAREFEEIEFVGGEPQDVSEYQPPDGDASEDQPPDGDASEDQPPEGDAPEDQPPAEGPQDVEENAEENTPSPEGEPISSVVCIDAQHVSHLERDELVYRKDVTAEVLCDVRGSCATAGHMVVFEGVAMRMKAYCGIVGCSREVRKVNSPRYRRKLRVKSMTEGLEFTAFAARYETRMEEVALAMAVNLGL